jgi:two-component system LytT family response regulator
MKIRALIVDDMQLAREGLSDYLASDSEIEVIGECKNGNEAINIIEKHKPDLVFLDVQMPGAGGFEVVEKIGLTEMPSVIFVTAYDEFALRAFEVNAIDYLLKPFDDKRLFKAVAKAKNEIKKKSLTDGLDEKLAQLLKQIKTTSENKYLKRFTVKNGNRILLLPAEHIEWISAASNYVELHLNKELHLLRENIGELEQNLDPEKFVRIHRSTIINLDFIQMICPLFGGEHLVIMRDGTELSLSRTYHKRLLSIFG